MTTVAEGLGRGPEEADGVDEGVNVPVWVGVDVADCVAEVLLDGEAVVEGVEVELTDAERLIEGVNDEVSVGLCVVDRVATLPRCHNRAPIEGPIQVYMYPHCYGMMT